MRIRGRLAGASRSLEDELQLTFIVEDVKASDIEALGELDIEISKHKDKHSAEALRYMWKLCTLIAEKLKSDKETIYFIKLRDQGVFEDRLIFADEYEDQFLKFKFVDVMHQFTTLYLDNNGEEQEAEMMYIRGYYGCHGYDSAQMSRLISDLVDEAQELGIDTWSQEEIEHYCSIWKAMK